MALISELYFLMTHEEGIAKIRPELMKKNLEKAKKFAINSVKVADFGTRRRYSFENQLNVCKDLQSFHDSKSFFMGTSNPLIAMMLDLPVLGTYAHEWVSGIAALKGYAHANKEAMEAWMSFYGGDLGTALPDTFGHDAFFRDFITLFAKLYDSVRHDSGDPYKFTDQTVAHYKKLRINPLSKTIIFSNAMTTDSSVEMSNYCKGKIDNVCAPGTHFSNDVGVKPLNMVIKMVMIDGNHVIKLSEDAGKVTGDAETADHVRFMLNIKDNKENDNTATMSGMEAFHERQRTCEHEWQQGQGGTFCKHCGVVD